MAHATIDVLSCPTVLDFSNHDGFFDSTHRAIPFLPNPGCHPWGDQAVPSTSRRWCLCEYTYSRRIPLWNIHHDKCLCRYLIIVGTGFQMNKPVLSVHIQTEYGGPEVLVCSTWNLIPKLISVILHLFAQEHSQEDRQVTVSHLAVMDSAFFWDFNPSLWCTVTFPTETQFGG